MDQDTEPTEQPTASSEDSPFVAARGELVLLCHPETEITRQNITTLIETTQHYLALMASTDPIYLETQHRDDAHVLAQEAQQCTSIDELLSIITKQRDKHAPSWVQDWTRGWMQKTGGRFYHALNDLHQMLEAKQSAAMAWLNKQKTEKSLQDLLKKERQTKKNLEESLKNTTQKLHGAEQTLHALKEENQRLNAQLKTEQSDHQETQKELEKSQKTLIFSQNTCDHLQKANENLTKNNKTIQQGLEKTQKENMSLLTDLHTSNKESDYWKAKCVDLEGRNAYLAAKHEICTTLKPQNGTKPKHV